MLLLSCSKMQEPSATQMNDVMAGPLSYDMMVLGERLENPYKTENITKALNSLYPTKAGRVDVKTTDLYVRFLPENEYEFKLLEKAGIELLDHPLDYSILKEGDWYHDPEIPEGCITWQYAVVPKDFNFPPVRYEVIDECHISEHSSMTRSSGVDWAEVEAEAYRLTGNEGMLDGGQTRAASKSVPSGRITIVDDEANGAKPFGVAGVRVSCNTFVKFDHCYTDRDGYYTMNKSYSSSPRYRLVFQNEKGFSIGFNLVLVPASVSTLGKGSPEGLSAMITSESDGKLFRRCAVNNSAYDYYSRCSNDDLGISLPPSDLRIWLFHGLDVSSAAMFHHGTVIESGMIRSFLGEFAALIKFFLPDITIGTRNLKTYKRIYSTVCHELSHSSHFSRTGTDFWNKYIYYIISSFIKTGGSTYGDGEGDNAGYCEIGEMWAYYMESLMYKERYGGDFPSFGTSYWFYPQIFRSLDERGFGAKEILSVLDGDICSRSSLKEALISSYPMERTLVEQVFSRYGE